MEHHFSTSLSVVGRTAASVLAGGVGSAVGLAVAYPIDVLKTKAQVTVCTGGKANESVSERARNILRHEGIAGFYGGLKTAMIGKAFTSSISFGANQLAIGVLNATNFLVGGGGGRAAGTPFVTLLLAACFAGFVQTFMNCPIGKFASESLRGIASHAIKDDNLNLVSSRKRTSEGYDASSRKSILVRQRA
jgi:hypothetical protein